MLPKKQIIKFKEGNTEEYRRIQKNTLKYFDLHFILTVDQTITYMWIQYYERIEWITF